MCWLPEHRSIFTQGVEKFTLVIMWSLVFVPGFSQTTDKDFAIAVTGDTLRGEVRFTFYNQSENLLVNTDNGRVMLNITRVRIAHFGGYDYEPVRLRDRYVLMRILKPGYLTKYQYRSDPESPLFDAYYIARQGGSGLEVPNIGFRKSMEHFLSDCPAVREGLEKRTWSRNELDAVIDAYNDCIGARTSAPSGRTGIDSSAWKKFGKALIAAEEFQRKKDALEIFNEIDLRIRNHSDIPEFLFHSMQSALKTEARLLNQFNAMLH